jgi:hypothetical protein
VEDFVAAARYLKDRGIGLSIRGGETGSPVGRVLADETHGVSVFLTPRN